MGPLLILSYESQTYGPGCPTPPDFTDVSSPCFDQQDYHGLPSIDCTRIETYYRWLLSNLPVRTDDSLRQSGLQVLGILLLCCSANLTVDTIRMTTEFITKHYS